MKNQSERLNCFALKVFHLILTGLQPGDSAIHKSMNGFNGLRAGQIVTLYDSTFPYNYSAETVKTVHRFALRLITGLKPGDYEKRTFEVKPV